MFGFTYNNKAIKRAIQLFGTLFNDIHINRYDSSNTLTQTIKVPIMYSPRDIFLARVREDPKLNRPYSISLPRMGFEIVSYQYDPERKLRSIGKIKSNDKSSYQFNPVPYNIGFQLYIAVKNDEDGVNIIEEILPFFTPDWTITAEILDGYESKDIPLVIQGISSQDTYEEAYKEKRFIIWTLNFIMKTYVYGPDKSANTGLIKLANVNFYIPNTNTAAEGVNITEWAEEVVITPGVDANGNPTTNTSIAIPYQNVSPNSTFDYIIEINRNNQ